VSSPAAVAQGGLKTTKMMYLLGLRVAVKKKDRSLDPLRKHQEATLKAIGFQEADLGNGNFCMKNKNVSHCRWFRRSSICAGF